MTVGEAVRSGLINNETLGYFIVKTWQFLVSIGLKKDYWSLLIDRPNDKSSTWWAQHKRKDLPLQTHYYNYRWCGMADSVCYVCFPNKSVQLLGQLVYLFTYWQEGRIQTFTVSSLVRFQLLMLKKSKVLQLRLRGTCAQLCFTWFGFHILPCPLPGIHSIPAAPAHRDGTLCLWLLGCWDFWILWLVGVCWYCRSLCFWLNSSRKCSEMRLAIQGN